MRAYIYDDLPGDQRLAHDSGISVSGAELEALGVIYRQLSRSEDVDRLAVERNYKNRDMVNITPHTMGGDKAYLEKLAVFFSEHLHEDEEIRYIIAGSGYFDVRDKGERWVRCQVEKDDLLILPAGIYHRFTTDSNNHIEALRLFQEEPKWVAFNRPADDLGARDEYLKLIS